jgi:hypothetical protein
VAVTGDALRIANGLPPDHNATESTIRAASVYLERAVQISGKSGSEAGRVRRQLVERSLAQVEELGDTSPGAVRSALLAKADDAERCLEALEN